MLSSQAYCTPHFKSVHDDIITKPLLLLNAPKSLPFVLFVFVSFDYSPYSTFYSFTEILTFGDTWYKRKSEITHRRSRMTAVLSGS